jgi:hypothetical protein
MARYHRVIVVRLDLHPTDNDDFKDVVVDMKRFCKSFKKKLSSLKTKVAYCWTKEVGREKYNSGIHWHIWVAVKRDNNLLPGSYAEWVQNVIIKSWERYAYGSNKRNNKAAWFYLERNNITYDVRLSEQQAIADNPLKPKGVLINSGIITTRKNKRDNNMALGGVIDECFYALSYLAKVFSKKRTGEMRGQRLFASSNLNTTDNKKGRQKSIEATLEEIHKHLSIKLSPMPVKQ